MSIRLRETVDIVSTTRKKELDPEHDLEQQAKSLYTTDLELFVLGQIVRDVEKQAFSTYMDGNSEIVDTLRMHLHGAESHCPTKEFHIGLSVTVMNFSIKWFFIGWYMQEWSQQTGEDLTPETAMVFGQTVGNDELYNEIDKLLEEEKAIQPFFFFDATGTVGSVFSVLFEEGEPAKGLNDEQLKDLVEKAVRIACLSNFNLGMRSWQAVHDKKQLDMALQE